MCTDLVDGLPVDCFYDGEHGDAKFQFDVALPDGSRERLVLEVTVEMFDANPRPIGFAHAFLRDGDGAGGEWIKRQEKKLRQTSPLLRKAASLSSSGLATLAQSLRLRIKRATKVKTLEAITLAARLVLVRSDRVGSLSSELRDYMIQAGIRLAYNTREQKTAQALTSLKNAISEALHD